MLSKLAKAALVATSAAPIFVAAAFARWRAEGSPSEVLALIAISALLAAAALWIIRHADGSLQVSTLDIKKAKSADKEILAFFLAYASPIFLSKMIEVSIVDIVVYGALIVMVLLGTNSLNVNPVLGLLGYNYYEIDSEDGISYLLISRRKIYDVKQIKHVVQLTEYAVIEKDP